MDDQYLANLMKNGLNYRHHNNKVKRYRQYQQLAQQFTENIGLWFLGGGNWSTRTHNFSGDRAGSDRSGSCKFNYHMITTTVAP